MKKKDLNILFIGNSHTYFNDMSRRVKLRNEHYNHDLPTPGILGSQPEGKTDDRQKPDSAAAE